MEYRLSFLWCEKKNDFAYDIELIMIQPWKNQKQKQNKGKKQKQKREIDDEAL